MSAPLLDQLARYGDHLDDAIGAHLHAATDPARDPRPSWRRPRAAVAAAVASSLLAGLALIALGGSGERAEAWAGWSATVQVTDLDDLAALDAACHSDDGLPLVAVDVRGDGGAVLYADDRGWMLCQARRDADGSFAPSTRLGRRGDDLAVARAVADRDRPIVTVALGRQGDPAASFAWGVHDRSLAGIDLTTGDGTIETSLHDDLWLAWWPTAGAHEARAVGRDHADAVVVDRPAGALAAPPPDADVLAAQIAAAGTPLERDVLADGVVTWPELQRGLDAWASCVADSGHRLTIEVDHANRTYQAISEHVSVPAPRGRPDDLAGQALLEPVEAAIDACYERELARIEHVAAQR